MAEKKTQRNTKVNLTAIITSTIVVIAMIAIIVAIVFGLTMLVVNIVGAVTGNPEETTAIIEDPFIVEGDYIDIDVGADKDDIVAYGGVDFSPKPNYVKPATPIPEKESRPVKLVKDLIGEPVFEHNFATLTSMELPGKYYPGVDYSSFMAFEDWRMISDTTTPAYQVTHAEDTYTDEYGFIRKPSKMGAFKVNSSADDYVVAMGTFYMTHKTAGERFLIVTDKGMFTVVIGDEKADKDTEEHNMFGWHGPYAGVIEFVVDTHAIEKSAKLAGSMTASSMEFINDAEVLYIYKIEQQ